MAEQDRISRIYKKAQDKRILSPDMTEDAFRSSMANENDRKGFYDFAKQNGMNFPEFGEFEKLLAHPELDYDAAIKYQEQPAAPAASAPAQPTNPSVAANPAPTTEAEYKANLQKQWQGDPTLEELNKSASPYAGMTDEQLREAERAAIERGNAYSRQQAENAKKEYENRGLGRRILDAISESQQLDRQGITSRQVYEQSVADNPELAYDAKTIEELASIRNELGRRAASAGFGEQIAAVQQDKDRIAAMRSHYNDGTAKNAKDDVNLASADYMLTKASEILNAPSRFDQTNGFANFFRGTGNDLFDRQFFATVDLQRNIRLANIVKKLNRGTELSPTEQEMLDAYVTLSEAQQARANDLSLGYEIGQGAAKSAPFTLDMVLGASLSGAGKRALVRRIAKKVNKDVAAKWAKRLIGAEGVMVDGELLGSAEKIGGKEVGRYLAREAVETPLQAMTMPSSWANIVGDKMDNMLATKRTDWDFKDALRSATNTYVETLTERAGGKLIDMGLGKIFPFGKIWTKKAGAVRLANDYVQSPISETLEEYLGAGINTIRSLNPLYSNESNEQLRGEAKEMFTGEGFLKTFGTVLPMSLLGGAKNMAGVWHNTYKFNQSRDNVKTLLVSNGATDEQAENILSVIEGAESPEEFNGYMNKSYENLLNLGVDEKTAQDVLMDYVKNAMQYNASVQELNSDFSKLSKEQQEQAKAEMESAIPTMMQNKANEEATALVEGITNKTNNYVYRVGVQGREGVAGYAVSGDIIVDVNQTDGSMKATGNDVVTVKFDDGHVEQMQASELTILEAPVMVQDRIQAESARLFAKYANEETYQVGDKVYLTQNGQLMSGESSTIIGIDDEGIHVEIEDVNGQPNETIIPHEIAAEQLAKAPGETEDQIDEFILPDGTMKRLYREDGFWSEIDDPSTIYTPTELENMGWTKAEQQVQEPQADDNTDAPQANATSYPVNQETGNPDWEQMNVEQSAAALVEVYQGDKQGAKGYADDMLKEAQKMQRKLAKQQSHSLNLQTRIQEDNAIKEQRAAIETEVNKWQNIKLAIASIKTEAEKQAEEEQRQKMMQAREERSKTEEGAKTNTSMAERYAAAPKIIGNEGTITLPDGRELKGRYILTTPDATTASHDARSNFAMSSGYPVTEDGQSINDRDYTNNPEEQQKVISIATNYNGNAIKNMPVVSDEGLVYNGNGRWMAGQLAAANGTDGAYTQSLMNNASQFGFTADQVQSIPNARVAFQLDERLPYNTSSLAIFNEQETQTQSNTGKAAAYARKLTPQAISDIVDAISGFNTRDAFFNDSKAPFELINRLIADGIIGEREKAEMVDGDKLSALGRERLENIMLGTVFSNETIRLMGDDAGLKNSILRALPQIIDNKSLGEYSLEQDINDAIRLLYEVRNSKMPFRAFVSQTIIAEDGQVRTAADNYSPFQLLLAEEMTDGGVGAFRDVLTSYSTEAKQVQGGQVDIFGNLTTIDELKQLVLNSYGKQESTNEGASAGSETGSVAPSPQQSNGQEKPNLNDKNLFYHLDYGEGTGAFSNNGAYIKDGFLYPGNAKVNGEKSYIWWNEGKPYAMGVNNKKFTRMITVKKTQADNFTNVRNSSSPIGQWNGKNGFVLKSEYVSDKVPIENLNVYNLVNGEWVLDKSAAPSPQQGNGQVGPLGMVYDQFVGKVKEAIEFLKQKKSGFAKDVLTHPQIQGGIGLYWGDQKAGLEKILSKHPGVLDNLQEILNETSVVSSSDNRIVLESPTHKVIVSKMLGDKKTDNWMLSAYEKNDAQASSSDIETRSNDLGNGTAAPQSINSDRKGTTNNSNTQISGQENAENLQNKVTIQDAKANFDTKADEYKKALVASIGSNFNGSELVKAMEDAAGEMASILQLSSSKRTKYIKDLVNTAIRNAEEEYQKKKTKSLVSQLQQQSNGQVENALGMSPATPTEGAAETAISEAIENYRSAVNRQNDAYDKTLSFGNVLGENDDKKRAALLEHDKAVEDVYKASNDLREALSGYTDDELKEMANQADADGDTFARDAYLDVVGYRERQQSETIQQAAEEANAEQAALKNSPKIQGMYYTVAEVEDMVGKMVKNTLDENGYEGVEIVGVKVIGSRTRNEAREDSDLDVLVEYKGDATEDGLFNLINGENKIVLDGVEVDVNPITRGKSGTIEQFMKRSDAYLAEQKAAQNAPATLDELKRNYPKITVENVKEFANSVVGIVGKDLPLSEYDKVLNSYVQNGSIDPRAILMFYDAVKPTTPQTPLEAAKANKAKSESNNPILKAYREVKEKFPNANILFRDGNSYEFYEEDAEELSKILGIPVNKKDGLRVSSFSFDELDTNLPKIVRAGKRVVIADKVGKKKSYYPEDKTFQKGEKVLYKTFEGEKVVAEIVDFPGNDTVLINYNGKQISANLSLEISKLPKDYEQKTAIRKEIADLGNKLGVEVHIADKVEDIPDASVVEALNRGTAVDAWYNVSDGSVWFYMPNVKDVATVRKNIMHEIVAHKGLRQLLGTEQHREVMLKVWDSMPDADKSQFANYVLQSISSTNLVKMFPDIKTRSWDKLTDEQKQRWMDNEQIRTWAADEFVANAAENLDDMLESGKIDQTLWQKICDFIREAVEKVMGAVQLTNDDIRNLLRASRDYLMQEAKTRAENENKTISQVAREAVEKQKKTPKRMGDTGQRKIDDYGEKIAGARKDALKELAKSFDDATVQSLVALPFSKAFKRPDVERLVKNGVIRDTDAVYVEAMLNGLLSTPKPKDSRRTRYLTNRGKDPIEKWANDTRASIELLQQFVNATEQERDELVRAIEEDNPVTNPVTFLSRVLQLSGYEAGEKVKMEYNHLSSLSSEVVYVETPTNKYNHYLTGESVEDAIKKYATAIRLSKGELALDIPDKWLRTKAGKQDRVETGRYIVTSVRKGSYNFKETVFKDKQSAEESEKKYKDAGYEASIRPETTWGDKHDIQIGMIDPLTGDEFFYDKKYPNQAEANQALEDERDEYLSAILKQSAEAKGIDTGKRGNLHINVQYVYEGRDTKGYCVMSVYSEKDNYAERVSPMFETKEEAQAYLNEHRSEIEDEYKRIKDFINNKDFFAPNKPRQGEDYRKGKNITEKELADTFGFRGIQFGNWTNNDDRQQALNQTYDALLDLCKVIGLSPRALSLNGELGIAFGSRGSGSANAHYEPTNVVINLTKTRGAGSLAHEWLHALDNYFARQNNVPLGMVSQSNISGMRPELKAAWDELMDDIRTSNFGKRSKERGEYWGSPWEEIARLFAEYINDSLEADGKSNHFLSRGIEPSVFDFYRKTNYGIYKGKLKSQIDYRTGKPKEPMSYEEFIKTPDALRHMPYPTKEETAAFAPKIRNLFETIQEKVDEDSKKVVLFSIGNRGTVRVPKDATPLEQARIRRNAAKRAGVEDEAYRDAIRRGDKQAVHDMVVAAAKKAMPDTDEAFLDKNGNHKLFYHNTPNTFTIFNAKFNGKHNDAGWLGDGFYFYGIEGEGWSYGKNKMSVFLNITNPYYASNEEMERLAELNSREESIKFRKRLEEDGYDGVYFNGDLREEAVAFSPSQIKSADDITYTDKGTIIPLSQRFNEGEEDIRFHIANQNNAIFVSNAEKAVREIKQDKATPQQWLAMIEKNGGMKAGEDKWLGLSEWLKASEAKTITKDDILKFIAENRIEIEETHYAQTDEQEVFRKYKDEYYTYYHEAEDAGENDPGDVAWQRMVDEYGDDFDMGFYAYGDQLQWDEDNDYVQWMIENEGFPLPINRTRLDYTTEGLENKHEIALTIPTIEPWNENDDVHFGDAGQGRAVAWIRFGETTNEDGDNVLVIDEIQSKRHQEGREKGYRNKEIENEYNIRKKEIDDFVEYLSNKYQKLGTIFEDYGIRDIEEEDANKYRELRESFKPLDYEYNYQKENGIPAAPFEKNWMELAFKRMIRYAAENGYDHIAWTTGEQQAERYDIGQIIDYVSVDDWQTYPAWKYQGQMKHVILNQKGGGEMDFMVDREGKVWGSDSTIIKDESNLGDAVGKELATKIMEGGAHEFDQDDLRIGAEGMAGFYDRMLPEFVKKYTKKWGAKVEDVELPNIDMTMHSVNVTPEMKESAMQGQVMFHIANDNDSRQLVNDAIDEALDNAGIEVVRVEDNDMQKELDNSVRLMLEIEQGTKGQSSYPIAGAKIQKNLETTKQKYKKVGISTENAITDISKSLGALKTGTSNYVTIEAQNGVIVTLRLSNHNATVSNFDANNETNGISIVISRHDNNGLVNNGLAHVVEFFYSDKELNNTPGTPIADIIGALEQTMYSGEYTDPTGIAQKQEVNIDVVRDALPSDAEFFRTPNGVVYGWAKDGKIYLTEDGLNPNTKIHEYTHLWAKAMQQRNPEGWQSVVDNFKGTPMWDEVVNDPNYQNLQSDDDICSEALARFSGSRGAERMQEIADEMQYEAKQSGLLQNVARTAALLQRVKKALSNFWKWVSQDLFGIKQFTSPEEVADRVLYDLVNGASIVQSMGINQETDAAEMRIEDPARDKFVRDWNDAHPHPQYYMGEGLDHYRMRLDKWTEEHKIFQEQFKARVWETQAPAPAPTYSSVVAPMATNERPKPEGETPSKYAQRLRSWFDEQKDEQLTADYVGEINRQADAAAKHIKINGLKRAWLDAAKPIEDFQDWMVARGAKINGDNNAYQDTFLATGRVSTTSEALTRDLIRPLAQQIGKIIAVDKETGKSRLADIALEWRNMDVKGSGAPKIDGKQLTPREIIGVYAQAKDCEEAEQKGLPDRGAAGFVKNLGVTYKEVIDAVEAVIPADELNAMWDLIRKSTKFALDYDFQSGRITEDTYKEFSNREYYVPQRGWRERDMSGIVSEYEPVGKLGNDPYNAALVKARGRQTLASDPFPYIMSIDASSIISSENNKIKQQFLQFCLDNEELGLKTGAFRVKKYWLMNMLDANGKVMKDENGQPMYEISYSAPSEEDLKHDKGVQDKIRAIRRDLSKVKKAYEQNKGKIGPQLEQAYEAKIAKLEKDIEDLENTMRIAWTVPNSAIEQRTKDEKKQHEVVVLKDGERYIIELKDEKLANAINKKFKQHQEELFNTASKMRNATRFLSAMLTQYNPEFAANNFARDYQVALATLTAEHPKLVKPFIKNFAACQPAVWQYAWNDKVRDRENFAGTEMGQYLKEYFESGAPTGFSYMKDLNTLRDDFDKLITEKDWQRGMRGAIGVFSMLTEVSETAVRFAGYVSARQAGMSINDAAYLSKELTTNFDRAGEVADSGWMSWFSFFRATLNGNIKFLKALKKMPLAYSIIAVSYFAMGILNQLLNPNDPDDEVWASDFVRESNFVFGKIRIPTAHFLRMFFGAGVNAAMWMQGNKSFGHSVYDTATFVTNEMLPNYLNIVGNATEWNNRKGQVDFTWEGLLQGLMPSLAAPVADVFFNRDFMGATINREPFAKSESDTKGILLSKDKTLPVYKWLTQTVYETMGGNMKTKYKSDDPAWRSWLFDNSASSVEHIVEGYMPAGADMFVTLGEAIYDAATGTPTSPDKWPFVRKFYNAYTPERAYNQQYYLLNSRVSNFEKNLKDYQKNDRDRYYEVRRSPLYQSYRDAQRLVDKKKENPTTEDVKRLMEVNKQWTKDE